MPSETTNARPLYALIMAGGIGSRLWPRSRKKTPKQFLDLISNETMLQDAYQRLLPTVPSDRILIGIGRDYIPTVRAQLTDLPPENVVVEPAGRGTAPAIGLAAQRIHNQAPDAVMIVVTADHHIADGEQFSRVLSAAAQAAETGSLVTLGITPSFASTGYGYIERGEQLADVNGLGIYRALRFTEKPDAATAHGFVDSGRFSWNSGMFIWRVDAILAEFVRLMPEFAAQLDEIGAAIGTPDEYVVLERVWADVKSESIDYGIMERAAQVSVIPVSIGWNDVGSWKTLSPLLEADPAGNAVIGEHVLIDTHNTLVYSPKKLVATIGLEDMVIVETDDALLICPQELCQDVRKVVAVLRAQGREDLL
jgi:mannose-1-phosphate guanylyltransferase